MATSESFGDEAETEPVEKDLGHEEDAPVAIGRERALAILQRGKVAERGLLPYSSNHSFLVVVTERAGERNGESRLALPAVYKPQRGESPLWDFEWGTLCKRERAAFLVSSALGWDLVPPTVLRSATRGLGSIQFYVDHEEEAHYFTVQHDARFADAFRRLALFDYITNNADRKSGHCLVGREGRLWAIDHGLTFHSEFKLRTVIWEFAAEPIEPELLEDLAALLSMLTNGANQEDTSESEQEDDPSGRVPEAGNITLFHEDAEAKELSEADFGGATTPAALADDLCDLLAPDERRALIHRIRRLIRTGVYPSPDPYRRNYPWPPV